MRDRFGAHSGAGEFEVVIRFNPRADDWIYEKKWTPAQTLRYLKVGDAELKRKLSSLAEVQCWFLSWDGDANVLTG